MALVIPAQSETNLSDEQYAHYQVVMLDVKYWATRAWHPVLMARGDSGTRTAIEWLTEQGAVRGDADNRNDYLHPLGWLFLFREEQLAINFKLRWG